MIRMRTVVIPTGTPSSRQRSRPARTARQFPGPRKASCSDAVGKSSENSIELKRLTSASERRAMLVPFEVMLVLIRRSARKSRTARYSGWRPFSPTPRFMDATGSAETTRRTVSRDSRSTVASGR